jgi:phosphoenolpyruvate---glycerone phosphotransferase subunit DhaL
MPKDTLVSANPQSIQKLVEAIAKTVIANANELTELDRAIGDADHGVNLTRGFKAVLDRMDAMAAMSVGQALGEVGTTLIRCVGGASGPLYGKVFVVFGKHLEGAGVITREVLVQAGENAIRALMALGRSDVGQKTMLDVLVPVLDELRSARGADVLSRLRKRAKIAAQSTVPMVARMGRAAFLGERSQGHMDPGARSSELIVSAICLHLESRPGSNM